MQDSRYRELFSLDLLKQQVQAEFNKKSENLDQDDLFYFSIYERKLEEDLEAIELFSKRKKRKYQQPNTLDTIENKIKNCAGIRKNRMVIEFNDYKSSSVKSISVKTETNIKCTTRFMSGRLLIFVMLSLKSFIYSLVELLHFPEEHPIVAEKYEKILYMKRPFAIKF